MPAASHNHTQETASTEWYIPHNLNSPAVTIDVYIESGSVLKKILPLQIEHFDNDSLYVRFTSARKGYARIVV